MTEYTPRFSDPRVRRRCGQALAFVSRYVHNQPVPVAQSQIIKHFGNPSLPLGQWLKHTLLICVDSHWNMLTGKCKTYRRNSEGYRTLSEKLRYEYQPTESQQQQLKTGDFELVERSDRFYNPLQLLPKTKRNRVMRAYGYRYDYDIRCSVATLLSQRAQQLERSLILPHCEYYCLNRDIVRSELSVALNIPQEDIKVIITALFQGAHISKRSDTRIYHILNGNLTKIQNLKQNEFIISLRKEIREIWRVIKRDMNKKRLSGRDKAAVYRSLEKSVMLRIRKELRRTKNRHLLIHDGWVCEGVCDIQKLRDLVRNHTGLVIEFDWSILSQ